MLRGEATTHGTVGTWGGGWGGPGKGFHFNTTVLLNQTLNESAYHTLLQRDWMGQLLYEKTGFRTSGFLESLPCTPPTSLRPAHAMYSGRTAVQSTGRAPYHHNV